MGKAGTAKINEYCRITMPADFKPGFISVIIPVYRDAEGLKITLRSLAQQAIKTAQFEIIVANDSGCEAVEKVCIEFRVKMINIIPRCGSYFARNRAIEHAKGEYLAFTDADVKVASNWFAVGIGYFKKADYVAGSVQIDTTMVNNSAEYFDLKTAFPLDKQFSGEYFGPTANLMVRRAVFAALGGFDQRLKYGGDNEFGNRVYHCGVFRQLFVQELAVVHPPRSFWASVEKRKRSLIALADRGNYYPERFPRLSFTKLFTATFLPCRAGTVAESIGYHPFTRFLYYYLFCWLLKLLSGFQYLLTKKYDSCQPEFLRKKISVALFDYTDDINGVF